MGVLGFTPFLQKTCPEVIRKLPDRFKGLTGRTVVIDGTLITQRLYFAPTPLAYRHVLGWYRLVKEMRDADVSAICVFDGKERNLAKKMETERRRQSRVLDFTRGMLEVHRLERLRKLNTVMGSWSALENAEKQNATNTLFNLMSKQNVPSPANVPASDVEDSLEDNDADDVPFRRSKQHYPGFHYYRLPVNASQDADAEPFSRPLDRIRSDSPPVSAPTDDIPGLLSDVQAPSSQEVSSIPYGDGQVPPAEDVKADEPSSMVRAPPYADSASPFGTEHTGTLLASLYLDYRESVDAMATSASPPLTETITDIPVEDVSEIRAEQSMSKNQSLLTIEEGKFWEQLVDPARVGDGGSVEMIISALTQKSILLSESYERRTNAPTNDTYEECRTILRAMGVPCVESTGPFEAEALAASVVLNGYADYVASEDTDVLIYDAPLVRNVTGRNAPLLVLSAQEIRTALELDRDDFVDFALLLGTDFTQRIKNVGPQRALKFIREHKRIEQVIEKETRYPPRIPPKEYLDQIYQARSVFQALPPPPDAASLRQGESDDDAVGEILRQFGLWRAAEVDWDYSEALAGNYFEDNPTAF